MNKGLRMFDTQGALWEVWAISDACDWTSKTNKLDDLLDLIGSRVVEPLQVNK